MLLTDTAKTKETATVQKKRNLFGLGVTSLIAACSGADGAGGGETEEQRIAREAREAKKAEEAAQEAREQEAREQAAREQEERADALPFKAGALTNSGYTAEIEMADDFMDGGTDNQLDVKITKGSNDPVFLNFPTGAAATNNRANIHTLTPNLGQYDLVISSPTFNNVVSTNSEYQKGRIFIYWNVEAVAAAPDPKDSPHLEIKGATKEDQIGTFAPDFLKIGGTDNKYDMVIRSSKVDKSAENAGAIYILWDIVDYDEATKTIDLDPTELGKDNTGATSGSLAIYGAIKGDSIGIFAPDFLKIGGTDNKYDMVIRSYAVDKLGDGSSITNDGAIYILWDVEDYAAGRDKNVDINLATANTSYSLLTIYGSSSGARASIGRDAHNILYNEGDNGNKTLTNIDKGHTGDSGKNDIVFRDKNHTYVLFGDKIAEVVNGKVTSKTIDLSTVSFAFNEGDSTRAGFFEYNNNTLADITDDTATVTAVKANATGYRFSAADSANNALDTLAEVQTAYTTATSNPLSDADADLGVWDIA